MTISQDPSAPLAVLVGITGLQGGSVARALIESDKPYRIRGLSRDPTKPAAQAFAAQGVQIVRVSLTADNAAGARKAFEGADIAFVVTNFNEHMDKQRVMPSAQCCYSSLTPVFRRFPKEKCWWTSQRRPV